MGVMISSSHCKLSTNSSSVLMEREDEGVLVPSLKESSRSLGMMQASRSDGVEGGEPSCGSSMKFAIMN